MEERYTPEKVYYEVLINKLNHKVATDILISLLEKSDNVDIRTKCIETIGKLELKGVSLFKILENCMLSDEDSLVRSFCIEVISSRFPKLSLVPINWVIHNDTSVMALGKILEVINNQIGLEYESLKKKTITTI